MILVKRCLLSAVILFASKNAGTMFVMRNDRSFEYVIRAAPDGIQVTIHQYHWRSFLAFTGWSILCLLLAHHA